MKCRTPLKQHFLRHYQTCLNRDEYRLKNSLRVQVDLSACVRFCVRFWSHISCSLDSCILWRFWSHISWSLGLLYPVVRPIGCYQNLAELHTKGRSVWKRIRIGEGSGAENCPKLVKKKKVQSTNSKRKWRWRKLWKTLVGSKHGFLHPFTSHQSKSY